MVVTIGSPSGSAVLILLLSVVVCLLSEHGRVQGWQDGIVYEGPTNNNNTERNVPLSVNETSPEIIETCDSPLCVRKCCPAETHLNEEYKCVRHEIGLWNPTTTFLKDWKDVDEIKLQVVYGDPPGCDSDSFLELEDSFKLLPNGRMHAIAENWSQPASGYCLENLHGYDGELGVFCNVQIEDYNTTTVKGMGCKSHTYLYPVLMSISSFCLILTLAVYAVVPKLRDKTYGRCLMSLVTAFLMFYIIQISNVHRTEVHGHNECIALGLLTQLHSLTIFFWLNVMAFELWSTVRSQSSMQYSRKKLIKYSLYGWGCPFLITAVTFIVISLPETPFNEKLIRPEIFSIVCFFEDGLQKWVYMWWVMVATNLVNLIFFIHLCYKIHKDKSKALRRSNFWMIFLYLIFGLSWMIEIFSTSACIWVYGDVFNLLQGVFIFIVTVCNKSVFKEVVNCLSLKYRELWKNVLQKTPTSTAPLTSVTGTDLGKDQPSHRISNSESHPINLCDQDDFATKTLDNVEIPMSNISSTYAPTLGNESDGEKLNHIIGKDNDQHVDMYDQNNFTANPMGNKRKVMTNHEDRLTDEEVDQIIGKNDIDGNGQVISENSTIKRKVTKARKITITKENAKATVINVFKFIPLLFALVAVCTVVLDVYTDAISTQRICSAKCTCISTTDSKNQSIYHCNPPEDETCWRALIPHKGTNRTGSEFCKLPELKNANCSATLWQPLDNHRHPRWCTVSITTLVLSSVLNNTFLMYRMLFYYGIYFKILGFTRLARTEKSLAKYAVMAVIIMLFCTQLLPLIWLLLLIYSEYLRTQGIGGQDHFLFTTVTFKMFFVVAEDMPQLFLQLTYFYRALDGMEAGNEGALSAMALIGIVMTCANGAWTSRFSIQSKASRGLTALVTSITLFSRFGVLTQPSGLKSVFFFLVPAMMIYELTNWNTKIPESVLADIFTTDQRERSSKRCDNADENLSNNGITFRQKLRDYGWRCIDGLLFDGISVRGVYVSIMYLICSLLWLVVYEEELLFFQRFPIICSIYLFIILK